MAKTKPKTKPNFIEFSEVQTSLLTEIITRFREREAREKEKFFEEFNRFVGMIYEELNLTEKILKAPPGTYKLKKDFSGVDILPVKKNKDKKDN